MDKCELDEKDLKACSENGWDCAMCEHMKNENGVTRDCTNIYQCVGCNGCDEDSMDNKDLEIQKLKKEIEELRNKAQDYKNAESYRNNVETITDDWGYTRTIVHEMGQ